jgi:hypothetical protein
MLPNLLRAFRALLVFRPAKFSSWLYKCAESLTVTGFGVRKQ